MKTSDMFIILIKLNVFKNNFKNNLNDIYSNGIKHRKKAKKRFV